MKESRNGGSFDLLFSEKPTWKGCHIKSALVVADDFWVKMTFQRTLDCKHTFIGHVLITWFPSTASYYPDTYFTWCAICSGWLWASNYRGPIVTGHRVLQVFDRAAWKYSCKCLFTKKQSLFHVISKDSSKEAMCNM